MITNNSIFTRDSSCDFEEKCCDNPNLISNFRDGYKVCHNCGVVSTQLNVSLEQPMKETYNENRVESHNIQIVLDSGKSTTVTKFEKVIGNIDLSRQFKLHNRISNSILRSYNNLNKSIEIIEECYDQMIKIAKLPKYILDKAKNILYNFYSTEIGKKERVWKKKTYYYASAALLIACKSIPLIGKKEFINIMNGFYKQLEHNFKASKFIKSAKTDDGFILDLMTIPIVENLAKKSKTFDNLIETLFEKNIKFQYIFPAKKYIKKSKKVDKILITNKELPQVIDISQNCNSFGQLLTILKRKNIEYQIVKDIFSLKEMNDYVVILKIFNDLIERSHDLQLDIKIVKNHFTMNKFTKKSTIKNYIQTIIKKDTLDALKSYQKIEPSIINKRFFNYSEIARNIIYSYTNIDIEKRNRAFKLSLMSLKKVGIINNPSMEISAICYLSLLACTKDVEIIKRKASGFILAVNLISKKIGIKVILPSDNPKNIVNRVVMAENIHPKIKNLLIPSIKKMGVFLVPTTNPFNGSCIEYRISNKNKHRITARYWSRKRQCFNSNSFEIKYFIQTINEGWKRGKFSFKDIREFIGISQGKMIRIQQLLRDLNLYYKEGVKIILRLHPNEIIHHINKKFNNLKKVIILKNELNKIKITLNKDNKIIFNENKIWLPKIKNIISYIMKNVNDDIKDIEEKFNCTNEIKLINIIFKLLNIGYVKENKMKVLTSDYNFVFNSFENAIQLANKITNPQISY